MTSHKELCQYFTTEYIGVWCIQSNSIPYIRLLKEGLVIESKINEETHYQLSDKGIALIKFGEL